MSAVPAIEDGEELLSVRVGEEWVNTDADYNFRLVFSREYRGDRDEEWVVEFLEGKEYKRHNVKFLTTIVRKF